MTPKKSCNAAIILSVIAFMSLGCMADINLTAKTIKGNGNLITKEIPITDYDKIEIAGSIDLNYQQLEEQPYFQITVDENILEYLDIHVENRVLYIQPVKTAAGNNRYDLHSTKCVVNTNSKQLRGVDLSGSGNINLISDIQTDKLEFDLAGSAKVFSEKSITAKELKIDLAGSGTISLKGNVEKCEIDIAGSGKVISPELSVKHLKCDIAGSGAIEMDVSESIDCDIAGSGTLIYTGNPSSVKQDVAGSGKLIKK